MITANSYLKAIKAYNPPLENRREFNGCLLNFNEATREISPKVKQALQDFVNQGTLRMYPEYSDLTAKIADYVQVSPEQIMLSNGSDQAMEVLWRTFTEKNDEVIIPSPSFIMFEHCALLQENKILKPAYNLQTGEFPLGEVLNNINPKTKLVVICNPNNPTGGILELDKIEQILLKAKRNNTLVYVDEAYAEFSQISVIPLLSKYDNLIITRTFSKVFGLAGLRCGYAIASANLIKEMLKIRGPYDINMGAVVAVRAVLNDLDSVKKYRDEVMNESKPLVEQFFIKHKIKFLPSASNFIFFQVPNVLEFLKQMALIGVLLRSLEYQNQTFARITIGDKATMEICLSKMAMIKLNQNNLT